ncbi:hypothetical protein [Gluconobacter sphaericus]|uniref:Uncharacterized protein n=1 Tax=Gluconobacter sphaericus NBRC 12467 TaxID=1307951 RepID=A0AA37SM49_9PROT|nr:hypothetical protein [Gluconobacter sphaericus]MBF0886903.1 hypothetical protein [Gluconobacter sphaericus]GBR51532.1 hypothetical protein AA12467_0633 [Gluconobacter sphaericus NBRC 12467]GEB43993.1 hypothetical protein GSP01_27750 [Gluconobacter sphaericus NBRC 12467]GLQ86190.1 hypothetical protein GCM10007872_31030 [Gluconobacter sphaericus NBRC 12467]
MDQKSKPKPTKLVGILRGQIERIETLIRSGYTLETIRQMLEEELNLPIKIRTLETCLYRVRKERKVAAQDTRQTHRPTRTVTPSAGPAPTSSARHPSLDPDEDEKAPEVNTPWKPQKKINPNLLALKERLMRAEREKGS